MSSTTTTISNASSPETRSESRGSSVSTGLREEYEDLLRYAVVTPKIESLLPPKPTPKTTIKTHSAPPPLTLHQRPHTPPRHASRGQLQPELSRVESEEGPMEVPPVSSASPLINPPPPFTAMNVQQHINPLPPPPPPVNTGSHDQTPESHDVSMTESNGEEVIQPLGVDPEMVRLETQMDVWCLDLKRNVLAEFDQARIRMMERHQNDVLKERQQYSYELRQLQEELERYKELLVTYEQSISRKDHIITNLTKALQKQKERVELGRSFSSWKIRHIDDKRESFTTSLANRHHQHKLKSRVWVAWFGIIQGRWKQRVEKACQNKAEEVCMQLTGEYEERMAAVQHSFDESQEEVIKLRAERDLYEENMKKAFMRGICALNLEAMSMFRQNETEPNDGDSHNGQGPSPPPPGEDYQTIGTHGTSSIVTGDQNHPNGINAPHSQYPGPPPSKMIHVTTTAGSIQTTVPRGSTQSKLQSSGGQVRAVKNVRGGRKPLGKPLHNKTGHKPAVVIERHTGSEQ